MCCVHMCNVNIYISVYVYVYALLRRLSILEQINPTAIQSSPIVVAELCACPFASFDGENFSP